MYNPLVYYNSNWMEGSVLHRSVSVSPKSGTLGTSSTTSSSITSTSTTSVTPVKNLTIDTKLSSVGVNSPHANGIHEPTSPMSESLWRKTSASYTGNSGHRHLGG